MSLRIHREKLSPRETKSFSVLAIVVFTTWGIFSSIVNSYGSKNSISSGRGIGSVVSWKADSGAEIKWYFSDKLTS